MVDVVLNGVCKSFGETQILRSIDLSVPDGSFCVFVGPSGCGKSTLLRLICGLEEVTAGTIAMGGEIVNDVPPARRGIAMVFQSYALYPHMTVAQNMGYALRLAGVDKAEVRSRVESAAAVLRLQPLLGRKPRQLSGGQRQRVAIGRAIVRDPRLFLFDEPLSNLDAALRVDMRAEIAALKARLGSTMIYVTHDQVEAMTLADTIVVMNAGRIEQVGAPLDLYRAPANRFVAGFIGSPRMNIVPGVVGADRRPLLPGGSALAVEADTAPGTAVDVGIRSEHLALAHGEGDLRGRITVVEHLGSDVFMHTAVEGVPDPVILRAPGDRTVRIGEVVPMAIDLPSVHLFDGQGQRVACRSAHRSAA